MPVDSATVDAEDRARGRLNYLTQVGVSPDGRHGWVAAKQDNVLRGEFRDGLALTHETTVRAMAAVVDLGQGRELTQRRVDFNDRASPRAVAFSPRGDYVFVAMEGSNTMEIVDAYSGEHKGGVASGGKAPQGIWVDGTRRRAFVYNFTTRNVSVHDIGDVLDNRSFEPKLIRTVSTVASDSLDAKTRRGLQIFYDASDPRMSRDGYISCASCHLEGGEDGTVWDSFTDRREGLRNTISLLGRKGTGHGRLHWTANFDEVQDFEKRHPGFVRRDGLSQRRRFRENIGTARRQQGWIEWRTGRAGQVPGVAGRLRSQPASNDGWCADGCGPPRSSCIRPAGM